jgi:hypothetical protein
VSGDRAAAARAWLVACLGPIGARRPVPPPPPGLDWPAVLDLAVAEDLAPALAHGLGATGWAGVPAPVRRRLTDELAGSRGRHLVMMRAAGSLLRRCAAEGPETIVLKGPVLADRLYADPALRPCSDLDLLVRRADRFWMDALLRGLGHRHVADAHSWDFDVAHDGATVYETAEGVRIDLHWALLTEPRFVWRAAEAEVWQRSEAITVAGAPARGLGREDLLLYLAAHLAVHHSLAGLRRYWDVALLLERDGDGLDWPGLLARGRDWRVGQALALVLVRAHTLFGAPVPPAVLATLAPTSARGRLLAALVRRGDDQRLVRLEHLVTLLLLDRGRDLAGALGHALWPSAAWMRARYGLATGSRPALYRAHARRLAGVVRTAAGALTGAGGRA